MSFVNITTYSQISINRRDEFSKQYRIFWKKLLKNKEIVFKNAEIIKRASSPEDWEYHQLCRIWSYKHFLELFATHSFTNFSFLYCSEGLSNLIFLVGLPQHIKTHDREPRQVLLRIFGNTLTQLDAETPESFITGCFLFVSKIKIIAVSIMFFRSYCHFINTYL